MWHLRLVSFVGLFAMIGIAWLISARKRRLDWRMILIGIALQFLLAGFILKTSIGLALFDTVNTFFNNVQSFVSAGSEFVFRMEAEHSPATDGNPSPNPQPAHTIQLVTSFAFGVMPTIIFFSTLMSVLYYLGVMQPIVSGLAWMMRRTLGISGAESLSAAANIFVGQTEAPLVIRPYLKGLTESELHTVMVGGFATISGGIMAAYVRFGISAGHLLTASVISAPAAILISKVMMPEVDVPVTSGGVKVNTPRVGTNVIEAAAIGATEGMKLAINVVAMLIAFLALIAMSDALLGWIGLQLGFANVQGQPLWSLTAALGYLLAPIAWLMGIENKDCLPSGQLLGIKTAANEFVAYVKLSEWQGAESAVKLSRRSVIIMTYALCGFANFGSIGVQIAGIGGLVPERQPDLARIGLRAMIGGALACCMTGCIVGVIM